MISGPWNFSNDEAPFFSHGVYSGHSNRTITGSDAQVIFCSSPCLLATGPRLIVEGWAE